MAKIESPKKPVAAPMMRPADLPPAAAESPPESLDKVRDILFGGQMRAVESRLQTLEERLLAEQAAMRADLVKQIGSVQAEAKRELQALIEQVAADRVKRAEEMKALATDFRDALRSLEKRHTKLEEMSGAADAELRDSILEQSRAVSAQIERLSQRMAAELNREATSLRQDKVDISALVTVFTDMAGRLGSAPGNGRATARDGARS
jgi:hypothetical protein